MQPLWAPHTGLFFHPFALCGLISARPTESSSSSSSEQTVGSVLLCFDQPFSRREKSKSSQIVLKKDKELEEQGMENRNPPPSQFFQETSGRVHIFLGMFDWSQLGNAGSAPVGCLTYPCAGEDAAGFPGVHASARPGGAVLVAINCGST